MLPERLWVYKEKCHFYRKISFVKKNLESKVRSIISFILELWHYHHVVTIAEITHQIRTSFKVLSSKKVAK